MLNVDFLKVDHGDCIHISFGEHEDDLKHIIIDGGPSSAYSSYSKKERDDNDGPLKVLVDSLEQVDLLVVTHIDDDHIGGILKWFSKDKEGSAKVKKVWFNSPKQIKINSNVETEVQDDILVESSKGVNTSTGQGKSLEDFLVASDILHNGYVTNGHKLTIDGLEISVLTPFRETLVDLLRLWVIEQPTLDTANNPDHQLSVKHLLQQDKFVEDKKVQNLSSISFIIKYKEKQYLFLGDSGPSDVVKALKLLGHDVDNKINVEFMKLSHHGSKKSTSKELINLIDTTKYVVSSNGKYHGLPDKVCLARIIEANDSAQIYFNYPERIGNIFSEVDKTDYPTFSAHSAMEIDG
ncbi:ComEC/Rec2 family competence protein [Vibrio splendidus]|uniref:ComEC/Rec2 family competence protein n=1 Tax=Vibrio splendidus TaxID=29497 RepID=UPI00080906E6|nr:MBL fold metallo-hydrolase [Vibrio splendidus]SBS62808.1 Metallo-beta-lactamase superfamily protein [Vibrio splendidus]